MEKPLTTETQGKTKSFLMGNELQSSRGARASRPQCEPEARVPAYFSHRAAALAVMTVHGTHRPNLVSHQEKILILFFSVS
jgi:hypothetical protein